MVFVHCWPRQVLRVGSKGRPACPALPCTLPLAVPGMSGYVAAIQCLAPGAYQMLLGLGLISSRGVEGNHKPLIHPLPSLAF